MTSRLGRGTESCCPRCGSAAVADLEVLEHPACGAVKPYTAFSTDDGFACPECGETPDHLETITRGNPQTCTDCGHHFTGPTDRPPSGEAEPSAAEPNVLEDVRSRLRATASLHRTRVGRLQAAFVVLLLLSSAVVVAISEAPTRTAGTSTAEPTWSHADAIVIFRNDDLQPHYRSEAMRAVDDVFVETDVPVTQGVIPAGGGDEVAPNGAFCQYLRSQAARHPGTFEYALHGYTHQRRTDFGGGSEFGGRSPTVQRTLVQNGTAALEACIGDQPTTFIPPLNTYDTATAQAVADTDYRVISGGEPLTDRYYNRTGLFEADGVLHLPASQGLVKNWTTHELHDQRYLEAQFDAAYQNGSVYVQMIHSATLDDPSDRAVLAELIEYMQARDNVSFMTAGEFATKYESGQLERTETGWRIQEAPADGDTADSMDPPAIGDGVWERATDHWRSELTA